MKIALKIDCKLVVDNGPEAAMDVLGSHSVKKYIMNYQYVNN